MNIPSLPRPNSSPDGIISPSEYDQAAATWLAAVSDPAGTSLAQSFVWNKRVIGSLSFTATQIARLVSTVGATIIKARFLIMNDKKGLPHFTLALFATDTLDKRVSSYYVAEPYWLLQTPRRDETLASKAAPTRFGRIRAVARYDVPNVLAAFWQQWAAVKVVVPEMFASNYGPLRGYSYGIEEFVGLLRELGSLDDEKIVLEFDLHEYYRSMPQGDQLVHTFGMLLWTEKGKMLHDANSKGNTGGDDPEGVNLGSPCPPF